MGKENFVVKILTKLGEGNNAALVSSSIAAAKGIFRPIFTMSDKKEKPETKKYTAIREFLTEFIAIPVYLASGKIAQRVIKRYEEVEYYMPRARRLLQHERPMGKIPVEEVSRKAEELKASLHPKIKSVAPFVGVGLSALIIIPAICSLAIKPLMGFIQKDGSNAQLQVPEAKPVVLDPSINASSILKAKHFIYNDRYRSMSTFATSYVSGMKVGGV